MDSKLDTVISNKVDQGELIKNEINKYLRYWYWFVLGIILAFLGALLYLRYTPKVFKSSAKIKILNKAKGIELPSSAFIFNRSNINLENEIEILKSYRIIEQVVDKLDLTHRFYEKGNILTTEIDRLPFDFLQKIESDSISKHSSYTIVVKQDAFEVTAENSSKVLLFPNFNTTKTKHNLPFELSLNLQNNNLSRIVGKTYLVKVSPVESITKSLKGNGLIDGTVILLYNY